MTSGGFRIVYDTLVNHIFLTYLSPVSCRPILECTLYCGSALQRRTGPPTRPREGGPPTMLRDERGAKIYTIRQCSSANFPYFTWVGQSATEYISAVVCSVCRRCSGGQIWYQISMSNLKSLAQKDLNPQPQYQIKSQISNKKHKWKSYAKNSDKTTANHSRQSLHNSTVCYKGCKLYLWYAKRNWSKARKCVWIYSYLKL